MTDQRSGRGYLAAPPIPPERLTNRRTRRQRWVLGFATVAVAAVLAGFLIPWLVGFWRYANHDSLGLVDDPQLSSTAENACATMTEAVRQAAAPPKASNAVRARAIREQNAAVSAMIATIRGLGAERLDNDHPMPGWLADWQTLVDQRARSADALAQNRSAPFVVPTADGRPITDRMNEIGLDCTVPPVLTNFG